MGYELLSMEIFESPGLLKIRCLDLSSQQVKSLAGPRGAFCFCLNRPSFTPLVGQAPEAVHFVLNRGPSFVDTARCVVLIGFLKALHFQSRGELKVGEIRFKTIGRAGSLTPSCGRVDFWSSLPVEFR